MREIKESYGRIGDNEGRFDIEFWQRQGDQAIFAAALVSLMVSRELQELPKNAKI
jgi:hypothetical protein